MNLSKMTLKKILERFQEKKEYYEKIYLLSTQR